MERIKTGIEGFDELLGGGFIPSTLNLLTGCSGSGKTIFAMSYIYNGAMKYNQKGVYITLEEMRKHIFRDSKSIGMELENADEDKFMVYDLSSLRKNVLDTVDELESKESPLRFSNLLEFIKINYSDVTRLALDSIVPLNIAYNSFDVFRAELFRFAIGLREMGITSLITTEVPVSSDDLSRFGMEDFIADTVIVFKMTDKWGRQIKVHKMRGSDHSKNFVDYQISSNGLKVFVK
jgi:KaiC/GvpD/RAD55 family RecA-like ATPase